MQNNAIKTHMFNGQRKIADLGLRMPLYHCKEVENKIMNFLRSFKPNKRKLIVSGIVLLITILLLWFLMRNAYYGGICDPKLKENCADFSFLSLTRPHSCICVSLWEVAMGWAAATIPALVTYFVYSIVEFLLKSRD
jgi:hypothetical protein